MLESWGEVEWGGEKAKRGGGEGGEQVGLWEDHPRGVKTGSGTCARS